MSKVKHSIMHWNASQPSEDAKNRKKFTQLLFLGNTAGIALVILVIIWATVLKFGGISLSSVPGVIGIHSTLMVFFMLYLNGLSALVYRMLPTSPKFPLKLIHAGLHILICVGSAAGLAAAIDIHNSSNPPNHFYSLHSWLGIASLCAYYVQFLGGLTIFLLRITPKTFRDWAQPVHRVIGQVILYSVCCTVLTGLYGQSTGIATSNSTGITLAEIVVNISGIFAICYSFVVGYLLNVQAFQRRRGGGGETEGRHLLFEPRERIRIYSGPSTTKI